jgi:hypothetical protein
VSRVIAVFFSDTHGGHKLGLLKPGVELYDEDEQGNLIPYTPELTATQKYLWKIYRQDIDSVMELADGDPVYTFHVGDLTQGKKYPHQLVSTREADQIIIAVANMMEWLQYSNVTVMRLAAGTGSHIFQEATSTVLVAEMLRSKVDGEVSVKPVRHGLPTIGGLQVDYSHHGPSSGIRLWTAGNQLRYYLKSLMMEAITAGQLPPRVVIRAHFHELWRETVRVRLGSEWLVSDIILLPSYCGMGEYGRQATRSKCTISNGLVALEIVNGELDSIHAFERQVDLRTREKLCSDG